MDALVQVRSPDQAGPPLDRLDEGYSEERARQIKPMISLINFSPLKKYPQRGIYKNPNLRTAAVQHAPHWRSLHAGRPGKHGQKDFRGADT
ncbi:hypothetical protein [Zoogloea sp.]|uniref:hypothetical protein n=1 Tax=Zoogloea sp. TaxID=49181 RepID=UPI00262AC114|nr:hypothetical protein [uncultured Zoogloea sp.]